MTFLTAQFNIEGNPCKKDIVSSLKHIFNSSTTSDFYHARFQKDMGEEEAKSGSSLLDFSKFETPDVIWRLNVKLHDEIDVLKYDEKEKINMWSVGVIEDILYCDVDENSPISSLVKSELDGGRVP